MLTENLGIAEAREEVKGKNRNDGGCNYPTRSQVCFPRLCLTLFGDTQLYIGEFSVRANSRGQMSFDLSFIHTLIRASEVLNHRGILSTKPLLHTGICWKEYACE